MAAVKRTRKEKAAETRRRMIAAARECFIEGGYAGTPMSTIAERAGVAVQTLYFSFHTKPELLAEVLDVAVLGDGEPVPPPLQPWYQAAIEAPDPAQAMTTFASGVAGIVERVAPLHPVIDGARGEPEVEELWAHREQWRVDGYRGLIGSVVDRFPLRDGIDVDHAADVALVLLGPLGHRGFVEERGWAVERWVEWSATELTRLFEPRS